MRYLPPKLKRGYYVLQIFYGAYATSMILTRTTEDGADHMCLRPYNWRVPASLAYSLIKRARGAEWIPGIYHYRKNYKGKIIDARMDLIIVASGRPLTKKPG